MKNKTTIIISVVAVIVVAGALLLVFNPFNSSASAAESTPAVNASPDAAPTPAFAPAAAATDSTSAMLSAPASESNDEIIALFNNTFDTAHEDNRLPVEYDAWTDYELVVMHNLVSEGEFNLDGIALEELDSAYLLWREENYAEAEDKLFERVDINSLDRTMYIYYLDGADIYDYFTSDIEPIDHLEVNNEVKLYGKGIQDTSAASWSKIEIEIWNADKNEFEIVIVYINSDALSPYMREIKPTGPINGGGTPNFPGTIGTQPVQQPVAVEQPPVVEEQPQPDTETHYDEDGVLVDEWGRPVWTDPGVHGGVVEDGGANLDYSDISGF